MRKRAVLGAEIGVVDVAIDDVCDHALRMQALPHSVGLKANRSGQENQVVERLFGVSSVIDRFYNSRKNMRGRPVRHTYFFFRWTEREKALDFSPAPCAFVRDSELSRCAEKNQKIPERANTLFKILPRHSDSARVQS